MLHIGKRSETCQHTPSALSARLTEELSTARQQTVDSSQQLAPPRVPFAPLGFALLLPLNESTLLFIFRCHALFSRASPLLAKLPLELLLSIEACQSSSFKAARLRQPSVANPSASFSFRRGAIRESSPRQLSRRHIMGSPLAADASFHALALERQVQYQYQFLHLALIPCLSLRPDHSAAMAIAGDAARATRKPEPVPPFASAHVVLTAQRANPTQPPSGRGSRPLHWLVILRQPSHSCRGFFALVAGTHLAHQQTHYHTRCHSQPGPRRCLGFDVLRRGQCIFFGLS